MPIIYRPPRLSDFPSYIICRKLGFIGDDLSASLFPGDPAGVIGEHERTWLMSVFAANLTKPGMHTVFAIDDTDGDDRVVGSIRWLDRVGTTNAWNDGSSTDSKAASAVPGMDMQVMHEIDAALGEGRRAHLGRSDVWCKFSKIRSPKDTGLKARILMAPCEDRSGWSGHASRVSTQRHRRNTPALRRRCRSQ